MPCIQNYRGVAVAYEHTNSNSQPASSEIAAGQVQILFHVSWKKTGDSNWTQTFLLEITDRALRSPPSLNHHRASQTCLKLWPHTQPFSFSTLPSRVSLINVGILSAHTPSHSARPWNLRSAPFWVNLRIYGKACLILQINGPQSG